MRRVGSRWRLCIREGMRETRRRKAAPTLAGLAERVEPGAQHFAVGRFQVEEFNAHADAWLDDADGDESFENLALADKFQAGPGIHGKRLAGANETSTEGNVGGDAFDLFAGFEVDQFDIGGKGKTDSVAAVADSGDAGIRGIAVGHGDNFAHFTHLEYARGEEPEGKSGFRMLSV
jgi:hypothetical protein